MSAQQQPQAKKDPRTPVILNVEDIVSEPIDWLWYGRIPKGNLTMIDGDPGQGKSWLTLAVTAAVTQGANLPGDSEDRNPASVLLLTAEDSPSNTIRPRLEKLGAELSRVRILNGIRNAKGEEAHVSLATDIEVIEAALITEKFSLVIIDPINAYLGGSVDTHKDSAIRAVLTPLKLLAERHNVAILCIRHLTKSPRNSAIYRGQGSIGFLAAARVAHLVGTYENNKRAIVCIKNNLVAPPLAVLFEIEDDCLAWKGEAEISAEALFGTSATSHARKETATGTAVSFLREALLKEPRSTKEIEEEAKHAGISETSLKRARASIGVQSTKVGGRDGYWILSLPKAISKEVESQGEQDRPSLRISLTQAEISKEVERQTTPFKAPLPNNKGNEGFHSLVEIDTPFLQKLKAAGNDSKTSA